MSGFDSVAVLKKLPDDSKIGARFAANLIETAANEAYERGQREAQSIRLGESSFGATQSAMVAFEFTSFKALRDEIRGRQWRVYGDRPGQAYHWTCELVYIHRSDYNRTAFLLCSTHYDI